MLQCFILLKVEGRFSQWRAWVNRRCPRAWELQNLRSTVVCPQMVFDMVMGENRTCLLPVRYTLPRIDFSFLQHICLRFIKVACWSSERSMCGSFYLWASRVNFQHEDPNCCFNFCSFEPAQTLSVTFTFTLSVFLAFAQVSTKEAVFGSIIFQRITTTIQTAQSTSYVSHCNRFIFKHSNT